MGKITKHKFHLFGRKLKLKVSNTCDVCGKTFPFDELNIRVCPFCGDSETVCNTCQLQRDFEDRAWLHE